MISFLLELQLLQPWLAWPDLGRLERVARALHHDVFPAVWRDELRRELQLSHGVRVPVLTGYQLACGYLGGQNEWVGPSYLAVAKKALTPTTKTFSSMSWWRFLVSLMYLSPPTTWCFYRTLPDAVDALRDVYYFEVSLRRLFREPEDECCLSVGLAADPDLLQTTGWMVGWTMDSIGLHTDENVIRYDNRVVHEIPSLVEGDVVGCGWQRYAGVWMALFTVNGKLVYRHPFSWAAPCPMVVHDPGCAFVYETNFGATPFRYRLKN